MRNENHHNDIYDGLIIEGEIIENSEEQKRGSQLSFNNFSWIINIINIYIYKNLHNIYWIIIKNYLFVYKYKFYQSITKMNP